jgi:hypothetical protein
MRKYRFEIDAPWGKGIIVRAESVIDAREDAYTVLHNEFGKIARIKTANEDVKVMRRMPSNIQPMAHCWRYNDAGVKEYWVWLVY